MRILAAYKPSREGEAVLDAALKEARLRGAELLIVRHVRRQRTTPVPAVPPFRRPPLDDESGQQISKLREELDALKWRTQAQGVECQTVLLDEGDDHAEPILKLASNGRVDLIVVGIRRRSPVGKAVLGSEARKILLNADCPVLAVKEAY